MGDLEAKEEEFECCNLGDHFNAILPSLVENWEKKPRQAAHLFKAMIDKMGEDGHTPLDVIKMINEESRLCLSTSKNKGAKYSLPVELLALCNKEVVSLKYCLRIAELPPEQRQKVLEILPDPNDFNSKIRGESIEKLFFVIENEDKILNGEPLELIEFAYENGLLREIQYVIFKAIASAQEKGEKITLGRIYSGNESLDTYHNFLNALYTFFKLQRCLCFGLRLCKEPIDKYVLQGDVSDTQKVNHFYFEKTDNPWEYFEKIWSKTENEVGVPVSRKKSASMKKVPGFVGDVEISRRTQEDMFAKAIEDAFEKGE